MARIQACLIYLLLLYPFSSKSQVERACIVGDIIAQKNIATDLRLLVAGQNLLIATDSFGHFKLCDLPYGLQRFKVYLSENLIDSFTVKVDQPLIELGEVVLQNLAPINDNKEEEIAEQSIPATLLQDEMEIADLDQSTEQQSASIMLNAIGNKDPFINAQNFVFGQYNFRSRGNNQQFQQILINGLLVNDLVSGGLNSSQWSGLNDLLKYPELSYGLTNNQQFFGNLLGVQAFSLSAADQSKSTKVTFSQSNRSYNNRLMITQHFGQSRNGWAFSLSASRRWAEQAYRPGQYNDAYAIAFCVTKSFNDNSQLRINVINTSGQKTRYSAVTDELFELSGSHYYNPNWGWQEGKIRNAAINKNLQPMVLAQRVKKISRQTQLSSSIGWAFTTNSNQSLDWYNATDPRADYYRNMPSFYQESNPSGALALTQQIQQNKNLLQIDWQRLYEANSLNYETLMRPNYDSTYGKRALYVLAADINKYQKWMFAQNLQHAFSERFVLSVGWQAVTQRSEYYRKLIDLLGADYFLNYNMFAAQQFVAQSDRKQFDLLNPDRPVYAGDKYRYHYALQTNKANLWALLETNRKKYAAHFGTSVQYTQFQRDGFYANGMFPQSSYGKSQAKSFVAYKIKAGVNFKFNGRHYLMANTYAATEEPFVNDVFIAPRLRNQILQNARVANVLGAEMAYLIKAPKVNFKALLYANQTSNSSKILRYFNDDPAFQSFVNFVMTSVNTKSVGLETAFDYNVGKGFSWNAAIALGQAFYTNRPTVAIYSDNDTNTVAQSKQVFLKNYYQAVGPQSAYTTGLSYKSKSFWFLKTNLSFFDRNFISINPNRRSLEAAELVNKNSELYTQIFEQEKLPSFYVIDFSVGKSIKLYKIWKQISYKTTLYFNVGINNLLDNTNILLSGQEQLRYDFTNNNPNKFPNKYVYAVGRNFFANLSIKF